MTYRNHCLGRRKRRRPRGEPISLDGATTVLKRQYHHEGPVAWADAARKRGWLTYRQWCVAVDQWRADGHTRERGRLDRLVYASTGIFGLVPSEQGSRPSE